MLQPRKAGVILKKVARRFSRTDKVLSARSLEWAEHNARSLDQLAEAFDPELWRETLALVADTKARAHSVLATVAVSLGGGGCYPFLYYCTRALGFQTVVETGVAAGFSSRALLLALRRNGGGHLYSSDFPYFRLPRAEEYIGLLVEPDLRSEWRLHIEGDEINLPRILSVARPVELFHYDSDKSYEGRRYAVGLIASYMAANGLLVMDDIQDDSFFYEYVHRQPGLGCLVLSFELKFVGVSADVEVFKRLGIDHLRANL